MNPSAWHWLATVEWSGILWAVALLGVGIWLNTRRCYAIDDQHVRVQLFGITVRKIALTDIEYADTQCPLWNEHWCNRYFAWGQSVRLRRKTGIARNFIITPANRDAFLEELRSKLHR